MKKPKPTPEEMVKRLLQGLALSMRQRTLAAELAHERLLQLAEAPEKATIEAIARICWEAGVRVEPKLVALKTRRRR